MNPPIYPSLHSSYQTNIPAYGWPTSPWPSTHPFAGAYFGSSPMWMNPLYLNSRINDAPDTATGVPEVVPPSYPSGRSREEQIEKNDTAVQTTATDALTGTPVVPVPSDLPASHENEKGGDSDNPPNGRRRRRRRNNRNRPTTPSNNRPITPSADHGPRGQDLSAIAATRKRVRGSRPATRPPLASGRSPPGMYKRFSREWLNPLHLPLSTLERRGLDLLGLHLVACREWPRNRTIRDGADEGVKVHPGFARLPEEKQRDHSSMISCDMTLTRCNIMIILHHSIGSFNFLELISGIQLCVLQLQTSIKVRLHVETTAMFSPYSAAALHDAIGGFDILWAHHQFE
ncbi:hypothetical protein BS47DRAFT_636468 [Hydnum rufescens UP504]|uniref:Uncharacterized protein n=1 Tax=Hydnum rufescens UP504 TaxID=1448309 RepID=A0A9P6BBR2_9AGAM|nr:hypothetical protein BS47DRAFT_636468 [Hydnum rufescens UP504]